MLTVHTLRDATFRPELDLQIARDGADVVLAAHDDRLLLLRQAGCGWRVESHSVAPGGLRWRGVAYAEIGDVVATIDRPDDAPQVCNRLYRA